MTTGVIVIDGDDPLVVYPSLSKAYAHYSELCEPVHFYEFRFRAEKNYEVARGIVEEILKKARYYCELNIPITISPVRYWHEENKSVCMDGIFCITATVYHPEFSVSKCA